MTPHKKNALTWCISHVTGLKQTCGIKNATLRAAKKFVGVTVYWEKQYQLPLCSDVNIQILLTVLGRTGISDSASWENVMMY